jgi:hypothetical protein
MQWKRNSSQISDGIPQKMCKIGHEFWGEIDCANFKRPYLGLHEVKLGPG